MNNYTDSHPPGLTPLNPPGLNPPSLIGPPGLVAPNSYPPNHRYHNNSNNIHNSQTQEESTPTKPHPQKNRSHHKPKVKPHEIPPTLQPDTPQVAANDSTNSPAELDSHNFNVPHSNSKPHPKRKGMQHLVTNDIPQPDLDPNHNSKQVSNRHYSNRNKSTTNNSVKPAILPHPLYQPPSTSPASNLPQERPPTAKNSTHSTLRPIYNRASSPRATTPRPNNHISSSKTENKHDESPSKYIHKPLKPNNVEINLKNDDGVVEPTTSKIHNKSKNKYTHKVSHNHSTPFKTIKTITFTNDIRNWYLPYLKHPFDDGDCPLCVEPLHYRWECSRCKIQICWMCVVLSTNFQKFDSCPFCNNLNPQIYHIFRYKSEPSLEDIIYSEDAKFTFEDRLIELTFRFLYEYRCWFHACKAQWMSKISINDIIPSHLISDKWKNRNKKEESLKTNGDTFENLNDKTSTTFYNLPQPFSSQAEFLKHVLNTHNRNACQVCISHNPPLMTHLQLFKPEDLDTHIKYGDLKASPPQEPHIRCPICDILTKDLDDYIHHVKNNHFICEECFTNSQNVIHKETRTSVRTPAKGKTALQLARLSINLIKKVPIFQTYQGLLEHEMQHLVQTSAQQFGVNRSTESEVRSLIRSIDNNLLQNALPSPNGEPHETTHQSSHQPVTHPPRNASPFQLTSDTPLLPNDPPRSTYMTHTSTEQTDLHDHNDSDDVLLLQTLLDCFPKNVKEEYMQHLPNRSRQIIESSLARETWLEVNKLQALSKHLGQYVPALYITQFLDFIPEYYHTFFQAQGRSTLKTSIESFISTLPADISYYFYFYIQKIVETRTQLRLNTEFPLLKSTALPHNPPNPVSDWSTRTISNNRRFDMNDPSQFPSLPSRGFTPPLRRTNISTKRSTKNFNQEFPALSSQTESYTQNSQHNQSSNINTTPSTSYANITSQTYTPAPQTNIKCPNCNFANPNDLKNCRLCNTLLNSKVVHIKLNRTKT